MRVWNLLVIDNTNLDFFLLWFIEEEFYARDAMTRNMDLKKNTDNKIYQ